MGKPHKQGVMLPSAEGNTEHRSSYHHRAGCALEGLRDFFAALLLLCHSFQCLDVFFRPQNASRFFLLRHESSVYKERPFTNRSTSGQGTFTAGIWALGYTLTPGCDFIADKVTAIIAKIISPRIARSHLETYLSF